MSDQALVWKFAFGVLVLVFCAVAFVTRKDAEPVAAIMAPAPMAAPIPAPAAGPPPAALDPAPADAPDLQDEPVRIRVSARPPVVVKKHHIARHVIRKAVHRRRHRVSPYLAGRQHYPFDPRERWLSPLG